MQEDITINLSPPTPSSDSILPTQLTQLPPQPSSVPSLAPPSASPSSPLSVPSSASISETVSSSVPSLTPPSAPLPSPLSVPSSPSPQCCHLWLMNVQQNRFFIYLIGMEYRMSFIMNSQWSVNVFPALIGLKH